MPEPRRHLRAHSGSRVPWIFLVVLLVSQAAMSGNPAKRRRPASRPISLDVAPSPEVDARVADEVAKAKGILENLAAENLFESPYLVSAIYYHEGFLNDFPVERTTASPERRIVGQISNLMQRDSKSRYLQLLRELWARSNAPGPAGSAVPVAYTVMSTRRSHQYALDLFAREGSPVNSASRGIVVLADGHWDAQDLFSTTSRKGGNAVIVFDPDRERFYRYCHLGSVQVAAGQVVTAGEPLGSVGHTGLNASRAGHGRHLHFEANEFSDGRVRALDYARLRALVRSWRPESAVLSSGRSPKPTTRAAK